MSRNRDYRPAPPPCFEPDESKFWLGGHRYCAGWRLPYGSCGTRRAHCECGEVFSNGNLGRNAWREHRDFLFQMERDLETGVPL